MRNPTWQALKRDLAFGFGQLWRAPLHSSASVLCLALAVWLTCAVAAVVRASYRPSMSIATERLVRIVPGDEREMTPATADRVISELESRRTIERAGRYERRLHSRFVIDGVEARENTDIVALSAGMFDVLRVRPMLGRAFLPEEDRAGVGSVVILSHELWLEKFAGDSAVIGRTVTLAGARQPHIIVGVMPPGFRFASLRPVAAFVPFGSGIAHDRTGDVLARRSASITLPTISSVANTAAAQAERAGAPAVIVESYHGEAPRDGTAAGAVLLGGFALLVLLIACANVANLLLVRGAARRRELAIRMAMGASRARIVTQLLTESSIIAAIGTAGGLAIVAVNWRLIDATWKARESFGEIDAGIVAVGAIVGVVLPFAFGLVPALRITAMRIEQVLRDARRSGIAGAGLADLMSRLVVGSTAATVMLLAGALLVGRGAMRIIGSDDAFDPRGIVELTARVADSADAVARSRELLTRVGELSDVAAVAVGPMPRATAPATVEMRPDRSAAQRGMGMIAGVSAEYFATLSMELVAGRAFTPDEVRSGTPVAVVSSATAARLWPNQSPLGKRVRLAGSDSMGGDFTVVGVTPDVVSPSVRESWMEAYIPFGGRASRGTTLVARLTRGGEGRWSELPARIPRISGVEISGVVRLEDALRERASVPRYLLIGFGLVGGVGLVLVAIGLYAIAAFMVHRRTHEIGVRIALGADATSVAALLVRQSASRVVIGLGLGAAAGLGIAPLLASKLAGVARFDPAALLVAIGVVGLVSAIALMVPARRVSRVNALAALRSE